MGTTALRVRPVTVSLGINTKQSLQNTGAPLRAELLYAQLPSCLQDTFLDAAHLKESFPGSQVELQQGSQQAEPQRPFKVAFAQPPAQPQADGKVHLLAVVMCMQCSAGLCMSSTGGMQ